MLKIVKRGAILGLLHYNFLACSVAQPDYVDALAAGGLWGEAWDFATLQVVEALTVAASLSRLYEVGTGFADSRRAARDAFGIVHCPLTIILYHLLAALYACGVVVGVGHHVLI